MNRTTLVGLIVSVLIIAGLGLYVGMRPSPAKAPAEGDMAALNGSYIEHADYYDIEATYPTETALGERASEAAVSLMQEWVIGTISQFKKDGNFDNLTAEDITMMGFDQGRKQSLKITYTKASSPRTTSYTFTLYADTMGAHPNGSFKTFTFDTSTGAALALADLFIPSAPYLAELSTIARAKLPEIIGQGANDQMIAGTAPEAENFANFSLDGPTLVILFPPYAVASYAAGPQTLPIPLADLSGILKPDYKP